MTKPLKKSASLPDLPALSDDPSDAPRRSKGRSFDKPKRLSVVQFLPKSQQNMDTTPITRWSILGLIFWASLFVLVEVRHCPLASRTGRLNQKTPATPHLNPQAFLLFPTTRPYITKPPREAYDLLRAVAERARNQTQTRLCAFLCSSGSAAHWRRAAAAQGIGG